jgi:hypothetical protein
MEINLDATGWALLVVMSLAFGVLAQLIVGFRRPPWTWLIGSVSAFAGGFLTSEWMFATATEATNQPNIGGLSFDEALFGGLIVGLVTVALTWFLARRDALHHPAST